MSWNYHRSKISIISITDILSENEIEIFKHSKKVFKNVRLYPHRLNAVLIEQLSTLPSIQLTNIYIDYILFDFPEFLKHFINVIKSVTVPVSAELGGNSLKSHFPEARIMASVETTNGNVDQLNRDCFFPRVLSLYHNFAEYEINENIYNVADLIVFNPDNRVMHFRNLQRLEIASIDLKVMEDLIELNKNTLIDLIGNILCERTLAIQITLPVKKNHNF